MFQTFLKGLQSFRSLFSKLSFHFGKKLKNLLSSKEKNEELFEEMERLFFEADFGGDLTMDLVDKIRNHLKKNPKLSNDKIMTFIHGELSSLLGPQEENNQLEGAPHVILVVGTNGSGKTTSIAKLARLYHKQGKKVMVAACDTFRAAAIEQLEHWANKLGIEIIKGQAKGDPSAVAFDAVNAAKARNADILLIDTAGRLHTKTDLMHELEKIKRVCKKQQVDAPHETLLVLDATTGQNALDQTRIFHSFTPLTGIILTKLDGSAKGGIVCAIKKETSLDIKWVGLGEKEDDLAPFDAESFIKALLS